MSTSRRTFLKLSAMMGGSVGLGLLSGDSVFSTDRVRRAPKSLRILILGGTGFTEGLLDQPFYGWVEAPDILRARFNGLSQGTVSHGRSPARRTLKRPLLFCSGTLPALKCWPSNPSGKPRERGLRAFTNSSDNFAQARRGPIKPSPPLFG